MCEPNSLYRTMRFLRLHSAVGTLPPNKPRKLRCLHCVMDCRARWEVIISRSHRIAGNGHANRICARGPERGQIWRYGPRRVGSRRRCRDAWIRFGNLRFLFRRFAAAGQDSHSPESRYESAGAHAASEQSNQTDRHRIPFREVEICRSL